MSSLKIATLNINGMKAFSTQTQFKEILDTHKFDIVFLQESHVDTISLANSLKTKFGCEAYWSLGTNRSSGVGILIFPNFDYKIEKFEFDLSGRFLFVDLLIENIPFRLINIYAPNKELDRKEFFNDLTKYVVCNKNVILGGDFNCILNSKYDKIGTGANLNYGCVGSKELIELCNDFSLVDVFRNLNPHMFATTWHAPLTKDIHVRLDRFYISKYLVEKNIIFDFYPVSFSDHDIFAFTLKLNKSCQFGPSYWKFNDKLLEDDNFVKHFRLFYQYHTKNMNITLNAWDILKEKIKNFCILYSKKKSKETFSSLRKLREDYSKLVQCEKESPGQYFEQIETLRIHIKTLHEEAYFGSKVRSKINILENEEKPSNYFNKMEKRNSNKKTIKEIECNNQMYTESLDILNCFRDFYIDLYSYESIDNEIADSFLTDLPSLSKTDSDSLECDFTFDEFKQALQHMQDNKSPGPDGLTKAFYVKFFDLIGDSLIKLSGIIFENHCLSDSQRLSYITLLCKDEQHSQLMKNWRPISLLNYDYKIISKSITNRLSSVIASIVHEDQTCAVKGRSIFDNIHLLRNIIDYVNQKNLPCIFLNLDQEKAFDRVSYDFLFKCLHTYGFGENFIQWIKILYTNIQSSVIVNNFVSSPFELYRGVRQGCALSPLLYVLCLEPFANQVRLDPNIIGLQLPGSNETAKISLYADDSTGILTNLKSVQALLHKCKLFGRASGAKLNVSKTKGMFLGKWKSRSDHPFGISWIDNTKLIGTRLGNFLTDDEVWFTTFSKFQKLLNSFKTRKLSFKSKSFVVNSLACSKLWYLSSTTLMPDHYLKLFSRAIFDFIWTSKSEPLSRDTMYLHFKNGGQNIVNVSLKLDCLLLKHIQSLLSGSKSKWTYFAIYWIGLHLRNYNPDFASLNIPHSDFIPPFYKRCLDLLKDFNKKVTNANFGNLPCKSMYTLLCNVHPTHPRIESVHPKIEYNNIWKSLLNTFIDPFSRDVTWRIIHEIIPVQQLLCKYKISKVPKCSLCPFTLESIEHLFFSCPIVKPLYDFVFEYISGVGEDRLSPSIDIILYHILPNNVNKQQKSVILYLLTECKFAIWWCRNFKKFENRNVNSNYLIMFMLNRLKLRIHADFKRMPRATFSSYWIEPGLFCDVEDDKLEVYI